MIGLVIVTHGRLADEFVAALEHIVGRQEAIETVCIGPEDDMEGRRADIHGAAQRVDQGNGVAILTDMFGGTPSNLAISIMGLNQADGGGLSNVEVIAGLNLPLLVKLASVRTDKSLSDAVEAAREAGRKYISVASQVLACSDS